MCWQTTEPMEATGSSETSMHVDQTARNYIPEGSVRSHCRRNQKSHTNELIWQQHGYFVNTHRTAVTRVSSSNGYLLGMRRTTTSAATARLHEGSRAHRVTLLPTCYSISGRKHLSKSKGGHTLITGIFVCGSILLHPKNVPTKPNIDFATMLSCISQVT